MARIDYVELPSATAHELTRGFYAKAFGWSFTDYGPDYAATTNGTTDVGLNGQPDEALAAPLPVVRVDDLEAAFDAVTKAGGTSPGRSLHFRAGAASISSTPPAASWRCGRPPIEDPRGVAG